MANTVMSNITAAIVRLGKPIIRYANLASAAYTPGMVVYYNATMTCTYSATGTAASILMKPFILDYEPHIVAATKARTDIDDVVETSKGAIIWGAWQGRMLVAIKTENPGGAVLKGVWHTISSTAGCVEDIASALDPAGGSQDITLYDDLANGDTVGLYLYQ